MVPWLLLTGPASPPSPRCCDPSCGSALHLGSTYSTDLETKMQTHPGICCPSPDLPRGRHAAALLLWTA